MDIGRNKVLESESAWNTGEHWEGQPEMGPGPILP